MAASSSDLAQIDVLCDHEITGYRRLQDTNRAAIREITSTINPLRGDARRAKITECAARALEMSDIWLAARRKCQEHGFSDKIIDVAFWTLCRPQHNEGFSRADHDFFEAEVQRLDRFRAQSRR
ncbi:hypothetical protein JCM5350_004705 [Sporobolomyces pararoseus]